MRKQNKSLLLKWLWKFLSAETMLWKDVIYAKYEMENNWMTKLVTTPYGCGIWRTIRNLWPILFSRISFTVGNGRKVLFWEDKWINQRPLKLLFPEFYALSRLPKATVEELWTGQGWNLQLRRHLNDWELGDIEAFHKTMAELNKLTASEDKAVWKPGNKRVFSVSSAYKSLGYSEARPNPWPWKLIWKTKIPYKLNCFTWLLAREVVLTQENLKKRKFQLGSRCYMCDEQTETVNHLFLHCKWADQLWRIFCSLRKIIWVKPKNIEQLFSSWIFVGNATAKEERWKIVPAYIWWTIWNERN